MGLIQLYPDKYGVSRSSQIMNFFDSRFMLHTELKRKLKLTSTKLFLDIIGNTWIPEDHINIFNIINTFIIIYLYDWLIYIFI